MNFIRNIKDAVDQQLFPGEPKWSADEIPDLTGYTCMVTGGNSGIGKETVKALLQHNAKVYLAARTKSKAEQAIAALAEETGKEAIFLQVDLSDLKSVKAAGEEFLSKEDKLHILFNNAGVMSCPVEDLTVQGYDMQFGTNVLGHFYFTKLLLPALIAATATSPRGRVRIVNTSSAGHYAPGSTLDFDTFKDTPKRRKKNPDALYCQSKFGNIVYTVQFARRYGEQGIVSTSVNPGVVATDVWRHSNERTKGMMERFMHPPSVGASTQLWGGTAPEAAELNGKYLRPWAKVGRAHAGTNDPKVGARLWEWLEEQVKNV